MQHLSAKRFPKTCDFETIKEVMNKYHIYKCIYMENKPISKKKKQVTSMYLNMLVNLTGMLVNS